MTTLIKKLTLVTLVPFCLSVAACDETGEALEEEAQEEAAEAEEVGENLQQETEEAAQDVERAVEQADQEVAEEIREEE